MSALRRVSAVAADERVAEMRDEARRLAGEVTGKVDTAREMFLALPPHLWKSTTDHFVDQMTIAILLHAESERCARSGAPTREVNRE